MKIIAIEGVDGVGKSTVSSALKKKLDELGHESKVLTCPHDRSIIDLQGQERELAFITDRQKVYEEARRLRDSGVTVIIDRFTLSGVSYCQHEFLIPLHLQQAKEMSDVVHVILKDENILKCWERQTPPRISLPILREAYARYTELHEIMNNLAHGSVFEVYSNRHIDNVVDSIINKLSLKTVAN